MSMIIMGRKKKEAWFLKGGPNTKIGGPHKMDFIMCMISIPIKGNCEMKSIKPPIHPKASGSG